jgi:tyrosyl-tRNA synthetase
LSKNDVAVNASTYLRQLGQDQPKATALLDFETPGRLEVRYNSEWLEGMDLPAVIGLLGTGTVGQMLAKEDFSNRYSSGTPIALHEFLYPLLQGYDSVAVNADVELGGTDQKFNVAMGRDLQRHFGRGTQFGLLLPILVGLDGAQKMSKTLGNTVGLEEDPLSMYSKLEKVGDAAINDYVTLLTDLNVEALPENPREKQKAMALAVTATRHGMDAAAKAQLDAANLVGGAGDASADVPEASLLAVNFPAKAFYLMSAVGICASSSEARRQIKGGAARLDGEKITDPNQEFATAAELDGRVLQVGKKTFRRLTA